MKNSTPYWRKSDTAITFGLMSALALSAMHMCADVYDGSQTGCVVQTSVADANRATLSMRVQTKPLENRMYVVLAEYGQWLSNNSMRVTFNGLRERRICGFYGDKRVYSASGVLDDGLLHHVALDVEPGRKMTLYIDGKAAESTAIPDRGFAEGPLSIARRVVKGSFDDALYAVYMRWSCFRGRIDDANIVPGAFGGNPGAARAEPLELPPDPFALTARWERPKTTRRYLHGPFSERLLTFWREGKIAFGEVEHRDDWSFEYLDDVRAHAAWLVHGAEDAPFDFRKASLLQPRGGEPCHGQLWREGDMDVELEACAPFGRRPSAYVRLTVRNTGSKTLNEPIAFLLREGLESKLLFGAPDVYKIFNPSVADWAAVAPDGWTRDGETMRHSERFVAFSGAPFAWDARKGAARFSFVLSPGDAKTVFLEIGKGVRQKRKYATVRKEMLADWSRELARLRLPETMGGETRRLAGNLAVQMLQCLSMPTKGDFTLPRQGGLQRYVWPGDADGFLEALDAIGYGDYVAKCLEFYFSRCQRKTGEFGPFKHRWAADTAYVLKSFARHCTETGDARLWHRWRDAAFKSFAWIQSKRAEGGGLFPAMKASDHRSVLRAMWYTDYHGVAAYAALAKAAAAFGDKRAGDAAAACADYRAEMAKVVDSYRVRSKGKDEFALPITVDGNDDPFLENFMFYLHGGAVAESGLLTEDELLRFRRWLERHGYANPNGLYGNQLTADMQCRDHVWYTTLTELQWFRAWRRMGRHDLAGKALDACLKYALTDEMYVGERYNDANPWFYPWSPNASGSGRIIMMLLERLDGPRLVQISPEDGATETLLAPVQREYVLTPREAREPWFADDGRKRDEMRAAGSRPRPVRLEWKSPEGRMVSVKVRRKDANETVFSWQGVTNALDVFNLEIAREYEWTVSCGADSVRRSFRTEDLAPRFVFMEGVPNMRDLGGRIGLDSRRIRQGRIYRSYQMNAGGTNLFTAAGRICALGTLGIRSDIDLRNDKECAGMTESPLGAPVKWFHVSYLGYHDTVKPAGRKAFADAFRVLLDERNLPAVFHCAGGADRTGTLAFILNALLGVDEDELFLDWEVTGFKGGVMDSRHRGWFLGLVNAIGRFEGANWTEKAEAYVRKCGFTDADLARFRELMLEPERSKGTRPAQREVSPADDPDGGRRLNNFVVELVDKPLRNGDMRFTLPRTGWVHVAVTGTDGRDCASVTIDNGAENVCGLRPDGRRESMRWLFEGRHVLHVSNCPPSSAMPDARLTVRRVKTLYHGGLQFAPSGVGRAEGPFTVDFHEKHVFGVFNTFGAGVHKSPEEAAATARLRRAGAAFTSMVRIGPRDPVHKDKAAMRKIFEKAQAKAGGAALVLDEVGLNSPDDWNMNLGCVMQEFRNAHPDVRLHTALCDVINEKIDRPDAVRDVILATMRSAYGTGMFVSEHYLLARPLWDKTRYGIEMAARYADSLRGIDPFAPSHNVYYIGAYLRPGDYTPHVSPEGDMKVLVARFVHALATDGRFRDLGGVGVSRFWCDEEFARWACDVVRHYAVDGCTDDFAESLGYSYTPGILSNGDFMDGLAGWDARPAETGSLVVTNLPGAAKTVFARIGAGTMGDSFALFTRSASRPNILSRKVSGLVPGRLYSLNYATVDYDEMLKPGVHSTNMAFNAKISNACLVENGSYASFWPPLEWAAVRRPQKAAVCAHKIVFEARADEAELTFSDWRDGSSPGGRIGERLIMNNAGIRPYYKGKEKAK